MSITPVEVYYSFAEADASLLMQLERHLSVLRHEGYISTWHKHQVVAGSDWQVEVDNHLNTASLILLLISPDFLASDYQYGVELKRAVQRHDTNEAHVIPIMLRPCDWKGAHFEKLQIIPRNGVPLILWDSLDEGFTEVAREIRLMLETIRPSAFDTPSSRYAKIWQIPYPRNPMFTGREELLQTLITAFQTRPLALPSRPQVQAISGLSGVGKTQLAIEYAYRTSQQYQAVFWVVAENRESLLSGYGAIARALQLPEKDAQNQEIMLFAVKRWLSHHTDWLLIMDNIEDLSQAQAFLPAISTGHILLTTCLKAMGGIAALLELDTFTREQGTLFLLRRAGVLPVQGPLEEATPEHARIAGQICDVLGGLPLALDQAAAYIEETRSSLQEYLSLYHHHRAILLKERGSFTQSHPNPVATTWDLCFKKVEQSNRDAADLLRLCAFLNPDVISEAMLIVGRSALSKSLQQLLMNAYMRSKAIAILLNYSLISRTPETRTLSIHRLIQAVLIDTMSDQERQIWIQYARDVQTSIRTCPCPLDGGYGVLLVDVGESYPETNQEGHLCYYCVHHKHTFTLDV